MPAEGRSPSSALAMEADILDMTHAHQPLTTGTAADRPDGARRRRRRRLAFVGALAAVVALSLAACSPEVDQTTAAINNGRASIGLPGLEGNIDLYLKAQNWSQQLANQGYLSHSDLAAGNGYQWRKLGENVGYGYSIDQVNAAFWNSPPHRANILDPAFNRVGAGVTRDGAGRYWVVEEFMQQ